MASVESQHHRDAQKQAPLSNSRKAALKEMHNGISNELRRLGIRHPLKAVCYNLTHVEVREEEITHDEGFITSTGAIDVDTGIYTGRSPKDKYFVRRKPSEDNVLWGKDNQPISPDIFDELFEKVVAHLSSVEGPLYVFDGYVGARKKSSRRVRVVSESAYHHHFCLNMLLTVEKVEGPDAPPASPATWNPEVTVLVAPACHNPDFARMRMHSDTFVLWDLERHLNIIGGTEYSGEIKKGLFSYMNYILPMEGILSMHCSATRGKNDPNDVVLFLGLSGTGKTTLSADPHRLLIGDDEHAWDDEGIFNLEGGCYAKVINLDRKSEADIYNAIKVNAILENVAHDESGSVDYTDKSKTENTRCSYPIEHIRNFEPSRCGGHPHAVVFLTCDVFGVLPPVSLLTPEQAMYHFMSGYTSKMAGTERGVTDPIPAFSACFGAAFMPLPAEVYARLLEKKMASHGTLVYLVNTGWTGGSFGTGHRMSIRVSRAIVDAIVDGQLRDAEYNEPDPIFKLRTPKHVDGVDNSVLQPHTCWASGEDYDATANRLAGMFRANWKKTGHTDHLNVL